jgi:hypothetical protein
MRGDGEPVTLMVRSLTPQESLYAQFVYDTAYNEARLNGLEPEQACINRAIDSGLWDKDKEKLTHLYRTEISRLEKEREKFSDNKGKSALIWKDLVKAKKKLEEIQILRQEITTLSAESHAMVIQNHYVISRCVLYGSGTPVWPTYEDFLNERDASFVTSVMGAYVKMRPSTEKQLRALARSSVWGIMWRAAKASGNLFDKPTSLMTSEQISLSYWSMMYDSVYESLERPDDKIINDDEALDKWWEEQGDKKKKEAKRRAHKGKSTDRHPEQFLIAKTDEEADDIWNMNDKTTMAMIKAEQKKLEAKTGQRVDITELKHGELMKFAKSGKANSGFSVTLGGQARVRRK